MSQKIPSCIAALNNKLFSLVLIIIVFLLVFGLYLFTLTPTVDFIDSGEFAAVCSTLGIAHPSGYPLFTLLGHAFSLLPIAPTAIMRLNIMNALFAAVGIVFFILFLKQLLASCFQVKHEIQSDQEVENTPEPESAKKKPKTKKKGKRKKKIKRSVYTTRKAIAKTEIKKPVISQMIIPDNSQWLLAAVAGLIWAFSFIYWDAATSLEVHSLHALLVSMSLFFLVKFIKAEGKKSEAIAGFLLALFLGFSFANHLTTVLLLPAFLFLFLAKVKVFRGFFKRFWWLLFPFFSGIAFYLYILIRAKAQPDVMWGNVQSLGDLLTHISGKAFQKQIFSLNNKGEGLWDFIVNSFSRLGFVPVLFIIAGIFTLYRITKDLSFSGQKKEKNLLTPKRIINFILLGFLCCTLYAATFSIVDNIHYYNCSVLFLVTFIPFGIAGLFKRFSLKINKKNITVLSLLLLFPLLIVNYPLVNKKNNYFAADFISNLFRTLEPNAILFASDVHILIHPIYYFQYVEKQRTDIMVIPQHGLRRGWFVEQFRYKFPDIYRESRAEIEDYYSYFKKKITNPRLLNKKYYRMLSSIINANSTSRPIYITSEYDPNQSPDFHPGFRRIPEGLAWRLYREGETIRDLPYKEYGYRELSYPHKDADAIRHAYMFMLKERGILEATRGRFDLALRWINQAIAVFPAKKLLSATENGRRILPNRLQDVYKAKQWVISRKKAAEKSQNTKD